MKTNVAAENMGAGDTENLLLIEAGKGIKSLIRGNNLAIHAQDCNADGNLIKQFEKIDRNFEKIIDAWQSRAAPTGNNPDGTFDRNVGVMAENFFHV